MDEASAILTQLSTGQALGMSEREQRWLLGQMSPLGMQKHMTDGREGK